MQIGSGPARFGLRAASVTLLLLGCTRYDFVKEVERFDSAQVKKEWYSNWTFADPTGGEYHKLVIDRRKVIERDSLFLIRIVSRHFPLEKDARFQFKFAAPDSLKSLLALRYFTPIKDHPEIAGYQVYFVFWLKTERLAGIYVSEVPLE